MPHVSSVIIAAALLTVAAVNAIAAGAKMDARNHYATPVASISSSPEYFAVTRGQQLNFISTSTSTGYVVLTEMS